MKLVEKKTMQDTLIEKKRKWRDNKWGWREDHCDREWIGGYARDHTCGWRKVCARDNERGWRE